MADGNYNFFKIYVFIYFWLHWVFVAAHELSLVAVSGGYTSLWCTDSRLVGSVVVAHGSVVVACGL